MGRYSEPQNPAKVTHGCVNARSLVVPQWVDTVKQEQRWARCDHLTILCAPAGESSVETAAGQRRLSYLDYNFRSSRVVCKGIPEEEHWRKQEDVMGNSHLCKQEATGKNSRMGGPWGAAGDQDRNIQ